MSSISHVIFDNGERYSFLLNKEGVPDYWVTLYLTVKVRPTQTQSSMINIIHHLSHLRLWESINKRDLADEFSRGNLLSLRDVHSIRDHCRLDSRSLKMQMRNASSKVVKFPAASTHTVAPIQIVTPSHSSNRLGYIAEFLDFLARTILGHRFIDPIVSDAVKDMKVLLINNKPKASSGRSLGGDPDAKSAPPESFERIMQIVQVDSPENPYKSPGVKFRNMLMFELLNATGMRAGELLALQIGDIDFLEERISIVRRHDAQEDSRAVQPTVKTRERTIPISANLIRELRRYIMEFRAEIPPAKRHPYLFVTHKKGKYFGCPVSNSTFVNRVVTPAINVHPELLSEVSRHGFRHYFNYRLSQRIDAVNEEAKKSSGAKRINEKIEMQIRKELNGWASDSSAETYNLRHIREEANRLMLDDIQHWTKFIKKG